jgi:dihydrofolate reductase
VRRNIAKPFVVAHMSTRKVLAALQMTIDGVAEWPAYRDESNESDGDGSDFWEAMYASYWDSVDTLLLGRPTYLKWSSFWPEVRKKEGAEKYMREFSAFADRVEKIVFSRTLESAPWEKSRIIRGDISREMDRLKSQRGGNMLLGGGPRLAQEFLRRGLVDELRLTVFPSVVGRGKPLFDVDRLPDNPEDMIPLDAPLRHDFRLIEARPVKRGGGAVFLHYARATD